MTSRAHRFAALALFCLGLAWGLAGCAPPAAEPAPTEEGAAKPGEYLFCHWNVENFFDDKHDKRSHVADKIYDKWFADNPQILELKLAKLTEALLKMNNGQGPDILALAEVESLRAAELLKDALNKKLDSKLHYQNVLMKEVSAGRHIAPAILTRLPVVKDKTHLLQNKMRILEAHLVVGGHELVVIASHWTSRLGGGGEDRREEYGDKIYGAFKAMYRNNPKVDLIVCGDFNDSPEDVSVVKHLHSSGNPGDVKNSGDEPLLYNLFADKDPAKGYGTHNYKNHWLIFDQILVSPGMLDNQGWICEPATVHTVNDLYRPGDTKKRPWRFGDPNDDAPRGYSDHFPVTVKLRVAG